MTKRLAVCDDEKNMLRQISAYLDQWQKDTENTLEVFFFSSAAALLGSMDSKTDLVLLDISMGGMTGMDCAKKLRSEGFSGEFVFITSMENYALEGYKVHAFAFLTKPLEYGEFKQALLREVNELLQARGLPEAAALTELPGFFVNLAYPLPGGKKVKFLEDKNVYLGTQVELAGEERCVGVTADERFILLCSYGANGADPELLAYKMR